MSIITPALRSSLPFQGVVFDLDGTLIDAFPPIISALNQTLTEFDRPAMTPEEVKRHTGRGGAGGMRQLFGEDQEKATTRFLQLHDAIFLEQVKTIDGAELMLAWLREHSVPVAVVTSKGEHRAEAQIKKLGWQEYFRTVIGKIDGRPEKPSPVPIQMACDALEVKPAESIMIGDGIADMQAGSRAGLFTAGIIDSFSQEELEENGAKLCFRSLHEVYQWLQKQID